MPLLLAGQTEGWKLYLQQTNGGFVRAGTTDRIRFSGNLSTEPINPSNSSTHLYASDEATHLCPTIHGHNTKRLTGTTVSIDGAASSALPIATGSCPFQISFWALEAITTSQGQIYSYNGTTDATPMTGVNVYMAEGGVSSSWVSVNGSANVLNLQDNATPDIEHIFYIACSTESTGSAITTAVTGAFKVFISYV